MPLPCTARRVVHPAIALVLAAGIAHLSCDERRTAPPHEPLPLDASRDTAGDFPRLLLSHTPTEMAGGATVRDSLRSDLVVDDVVIVKPFDIATFADGGFAILDRHAHQIVHFDSSGHVLERYGGDGGGPGEYGSPIAIAAVGDHLVVWDFAPTKTFTILGDDGSVIGTASAAIDGDWVSLRFRRPHAWEKEPYQWTSEETAWRLQPLGDSAFVHRIQSDERDAIERGDTLDFRSPASFLVRYDLDGEPRDTLAEIAGLPVGRAPDVPGSRPRSRTMVYGPSPVWATGDGWLARSHGDSTHVVVRTLAGDTALLIEWPARRAAVDDRLMDRWVDWYISENVLKYGSRAEREGFRQLPEGVVEQGREGIKRQNLWPDSVPYVTAAFGAGPCLWLTGFEADDFRDGAALTLIGVRVPEGTTFGPYRLDLPAGRIFEVSRTAVFVMYDDELGRQYIARYPFPENRCGVEYQVAHAAVRAAGSASGRWTTE